MKNNKYKWTCVLEKNFSTEKKCLEYILSKKLNGKRICPKCSKYTRFYHIKNTRRFDTACGHSIFPTKNTIFFKSSTPLKTWFYALYLLSSDRSMTNKQLQNEIGTTYKTAWKIKNIIEIKLK